jgi:hypothetical protein
MIQFPWWSGLQSQQQQQQQQQHHQGTQHASDDIPGSVSSPVCQLLQAHGCHMLGVWRGVCACSSSSDPSDATVEHDSRAVTVAAAAAASLGAAGPSPEGPSSSLHCCSVGWGQTASAKRPRHCGNEVMLPASGQQTRTLNVLSKVLLVPVQLRAMPPMPFATTPAGLHLPRPPTHVTA